MDERKYGEVFRGLFFLGACLLMIFVGFRAMAAGHPVIGILCWLTGPVLWGVAESKRRKEIAERIYSQNSAEMPGQHVAPTQQTLPPQKSEEVDQYFMGCVLVSELLESSYGIFQRHEFTTGESSIKNDESVTDWCRRTAKIFPVGSEISIDHVYSLLLFGAKFNKPRSGASVADWCAATLLRVKEFMATCSSLDLSSPESGRQEGESNMAWLSRVTPIFLRVQDGESNDDAIAVFVEIADKEPPRANESISSWMGRVRPYIEEHNASVS